MAIGFEKNQGNNMIYAMEGKVMKAILHIYPEYITVNTYSCKTDQLEQILSKMKELQGEVVK